MNDTAFKQAKLVDRLYQLTMSKQIAWELDNYQPTKVSTVFDKYTLSLEYEVDGETDTPYIKVTINKDGRFVESFTDGSIVDRKPAVAEHDSYWRLMDAMHSFAIRQARGADQALDELLTIVA